MKKLKDIFVYSLQLPRKKAAFRLNRIGMDYVMLYLFLLFVIFSFPSLLIQIQENTAENALHVKPFFLLIFFFIFNYLVVFMIGLVYISSLAYLGRFITFLNKRKIRYHILWKMSACLLTLPILFYSVFSLFLTIPDGIFIAFMILHVILLRQIILIYPPRKIRSHRISRE